MEQQPHRACERTKSKQKQNQVTSHSNWPRVLLFDLAHKQCNGIIKGWLHCLTPESIGRFLVNNILMFDSAWCLIMEQIQFSLIKKIKIERPEHSLTLHPPTSDNISFLPYPPPLLKVDVICVSPLGIFLWKAWKQTKKYSCEQVTSSTIYYTFLLDKIHIAVF